MRIARRAWIGSLLVVAVTLGIVGALPLGATVQASSSHAFPFSAPHPAGTASASAASPRSPHGGTAGWNSNFFHDISVNFGGPGLPGQFQPVPYINYLSISTYGYWLNISSLDPLLYANVTIWGTEWPLANGVALPVPGYSPVSPNVAPMMVNASDPNLASYYFDNYRFFWPGSLVYFNISAVGKNVTPSEVKSATNDSDPIPYTGGYVNRATWAFEIDSPWASGNFTDDIAISTTPNAFGTTPTEPNADQSFMVTLSALDLGGTVAPIPDALLEYTLYENGSANAYSEPFGPVNHTVMSLDQPLGPYPGSSIAFNISAWLPWEGGQLDKISSPTYTVDWSTHGGWWFPTQGLLANLGISATPNVLLGGVSPTSPAVVATDEPVNVSIHEPIENVTISSAILDFTFSDQGLAHSGSIDMTALGRNTSYAVLTGLPSGATVTFYIVAKDINGNPVSSGNFTYVEAGPTAPPLAAGYGLVFLEVLDLNGGGLVSNFDYTISNASWSTTGSSNILGFATPYLPGTGLAYRLGFGSYDVAVRAFGGLHTAVVNISAASPTPTVVFYGESSPLPVATTGSATVESIAAGLGLAAAAIVTIPLMRWLEERREHQEQEQRRITL